MYSNVAVHTGVRVRKLEFSTVQFPCRELALGRQTIQATNVSVTDLYHTNPIIILTLT